MSAKFVQVMLKSWPLTLLQQGPHTFVPVGKKLKNHFLKMHERLKAETYNVKK